MKTVQTIIISTVCLLGICGKTVHAQGEWKMKNKNFDLIEPLSEFFEDDKGNIHLKSVLNESVVGIYNYPIYTSHDQWETFIDTKKNNIPDNEIIYKYRTDSKNRKWALTNRGILLCSDSNYLRFLENFDFNEYYRYKKPVFFNDYAISNEFVYYFNNDNFELIKSFDKRTNVYKVQKDMNEMVWIYTDKGLIRCNNGKAVLFLPEVSFDTYLSKPKPPYFKEKFAVSENAAYYFDDRAFTKILNFDKKEEVLKINNTILQDNLWITTNKRIIQCTDVTYNEYFKTNKLKKSLLFTANNIYIKNENKLLLFDNNKFNEISCLGEIDKLSYVGSDSLNRDWFANKPKNSVTSDIYCINKSKLEVISKNVECNSLEIFIDPNKKVWLTSNNLLGREDGDSIKYFQNINGNDFKLKLVNQKVWIQGSTIKSDMPLIGFIENDSVEFIPFDEKKLGGHEISDIIFCDENEFFFICNRTLRAISVLNGTNVSNQYSLSDFDGYLVHWKNGEVDYLSLDQLSLPKKTYLQTLYLDSKNYLWILTAIPEKYFNNVFTQHNSSIVKISSTNPQEIETFNKRSGFSENVVYSDIFEDSKGRIWVVDKSKNIYMYEYQ